MNSTGVVVYWTVTMSLYLIGCKANYVQLHVKKDLSDTLKSCIFSYVMIY